MNFTSRTFHLAVRGSAFHSELSRRDVAQPAARQVLIRVTAASLNYRDLLTLQETASNRDGLIPLSDGAGTVVAVGTGVRCWKAGDRVSVNFFPTWQSGPFSPAVLARAVGGGQTEGMLNGCRLGRRRSRGQTAAVTAPYLRWRRPACEKPRGR